MHDESDKYLARIAALGIGAFIGAGVALLLAPKSGAETRNLLRGYIGRGKDEIHERSRRAKATLDEVVDRGKQVYDSGKAMGREALETVKETTRGAQDKIQHM
jgi:gas vesicle protein